jgi:hypothetical protein
MAVKLHRCSGMWAKFGAHPCWRVQKALDDQGIDYELVKEGSARRKSSRIRTIERTGQSKFPWIEFEDGSVYREESKDMAETIGAGRLNEKRSTGATASLAVAEATLRPARGYSSVGRAPGSHPGGRRFEPG